MSDDKEESVMRERILAILKDVRPDVDFETETGLISGEVLESLDLLTVITLLQDELEIEIDGQEISVENFDSLDAMVKMAERLKNA